MYRKLREKVVEKAAMFGPDPESKIQARIVEELQKADCLVLCLSLAGSRGFPDLQVMKNGKVVYVEVKKPGGTISKQQWSISEVLFQFGFTVYFVDSVSEAVDNVLRDLK